MRIATIVKGYLPVPAPADIVYAPIDLALQISDGLIERGHVVDFFAPTGSDSGKSQLVTRNLRPLASDFESFQSLLFDPQMASDNVLAIWDYYLSSEMFRRADAGEYDILHFHHPEVALPFANLYPHIPIAYTIHDPIDSLEYETILMHQSSNQHFISISDKQRSNAPNLSYLKTVYNSVNTDHFTLPEDGSRDDYLLFAARITPKKGVKEAVQAALKSGKRLKIAGPVFPDNQAYFDEQIKPHIDGKQIEYLGHVPHDQTPKLFQQASGFLMPIQWEEPFGLTMIEAMACGTPVIAMNRGSVPEIIDHGETGFIVSSVDEMVESIAKLNTIDPARCRKTAVNRFSLPIMVENYEKAFNEAIKITKSYS